MIGTLSAAAAQRFIPTTHLPPIPPVADVCRKKIAEELVAVKVRIEHAQPEQGDYSVYTGEAGIAYMYWMLASAPEGQIPLKKAELLDRAQAHIKVALRYGKQSRSSSSRVSTFMTGMAGVYCVAAAIHTTANEPTQAAAMCKEVIALAPTAARNGVPSELLYGRVGYLSTLLFCAANAGLRLSECSEIISTLVQLILSDGRALGSRQGWPLMWEWHQKMYLGAAHGVAGILIILLHLREVVCQFKGGDDLIRSTIDRLLDIRFPSGNLPSSLGSENDMLVHWCHGGTGFVSLMCAAHDAYKDPKYLAAGQKAAEVVSQRGLLSKGFGICHGISGSALSLLCMHRYDRTAGWDKIALRMGLFACMPAGSDERQMRELKDALLRQPDSPESLMEGEAGLGCLLGMLLEGVDSPSVSRAIGAAAPWIM